MAEFTYSVKENGFDSLYLCEYGESRSSGYVAVILEHFYKTGVTVFDDYRYYLNRVVYHKVFDVLERYKEKMKDIKILFMSVSKMSK